MHVSPAAKYAPLRMKLKIPLLSSFPGEAATKHAKTVPYIAQKRNKEKEKATDYHNNNRKLETQFDGINNPPYCRVLTADMQPPAALWTLRWTKWPWQMFPTADMIAAEDRLDFWNPLLSRMMPSPSFYSEVHILHAQDDGRSETTLLQERRTILMFRDACSATEKMKTGIEPARRRHIRVEKVERPLQFIRACNSVALDVLVFPEWNSPTGSAERHWARSSFTALSNAAENRSLNGK